MSLPPCFRWSNASGSVSCPKELLRWDVLSVPLLRVSSVLCVGNSVPVAVTWNLTLGSTWLLGYVVEGAERLKFGWRVNIGESAVKVFAVLHLVNGAHSLRTYKHREWLELKVIFISLEKIKEDGVRVVYIWGWRSGEVSDAHTTPPVPFMISRLS